jgi:hypothetical protein
LGILYQHPEAYPTFALIFFSRLLLLFYIAAIMQDRTTHRTFKKQEKKRVREKFPVVYDGAIKPTFQKI